jgi:hypothetical protein
VEKLSQLATSVMAEVAQDQMVKQAQMAYINSALVTVTGQALMKVATQLRTTETADVTYTDLACFRKTYGV